MTLQVRFSPAGSAMGRPGIMVHIGASGAVLLPACFLVGLRWGVTGRAASWFVAYPIYLAITAVRVLPVIGLKAIELARATAPTIGAALAMGAQVKLLDDVLPPMAVQLRLLALVGSGAAIYAGWLVLLAKDVLLEAISMARG